MTITTVWILPTLIATLSCPVLLADSDHSSWRERMITIETYNLAHVGSKTLAEAEQLASRIFATAGIDARWTPGAVSDRVKLIIDFTAIPEKQCAAPLPSIILRVLLIPHAPRGISSRALGFALPCARRGMQVILYADRVEQVSCEMPASFRLVLGYALAHEFGHVLLRSSEHEKSGLMKALWTRDDWQRAAMSTIVFTPNHARRIAELQAAGE